MGGGTDFSSENSIEFFFLSGGIFDQKSKGYEPVLSIIINLGLQPKTCHLKLIINSWPTNVIC